MQTLSDEFTRLAALRDNNRVIVARLFYTASDSLKVGTKSVTLDSLQFRGIIKDVGGTSSKWNIATNGRVTFGSVQLTLANWTAPDGTELLTDFATSTFTGRPCDIFLGFSQMTTLDDFLPLFRGVIEDVELKSGNIVITVAAVDFPSPSISGRRIDSAEQTIGGVAATLDVPEEAHGKHLPIAFGKPYNSPVVLYGEDEDYYYFAVNDDQYSALLDTTNKKFPLQAWRPGTSPYGDREYGALLLPDGDFYVPFYSVSYATGTEATGVAQEEWEDYDDTDDDITAIKQLKPGNGSDHLRYDKRLFLVVPLRPYYDGVEDDDYYTVNLGGGSDDPADLDDVFELDRGNSWYCISSDANAYVRLRTHLKHVLDLRTDAGRRGRFYRRVHIHESGTFTVLGQFDTHDEELTELYVVFYVGSGAPTADTALGYSLITAMPGAACVFKLPRSGSDNYNENAYFEGVDAMTGFDTYDPATALAVGPSDSAALNSEYWRDVDLSTLSRAALDRGVDVRFDFRIVFATYELTVNLLTLACVGAVPWFEDGGNAYTEREGITVSAAGASAMNSVPTGSPYQLRRPYEYMEFLLHATGAIASSAELGDEWDEADIADAWEDFFEDDLFVGGGEQGRDFSGFSIDEPVLFSDFMREYLKYEPFTVYRDASGLFRFKILKRSPVAGDVQGTLDYNDADDFEISLSPIDWLCAEIRSLKTGYCPGLDTYDHDVRWRLSDAVYDFDAWLADNTAENNALIVEEIEKPYTGEVVPGSVSDGGLYYTCKKTIFGATVDPADDPDNWSEALHASTAWTGAGQDINGEDHENYLIARWWLNMWANRHRIVKFKTEDLSYAKYDIGDIVEIENCPYSLLGLALKGFGGDTSTFSVSLNGQTVYACFTVVGVKRSADRIELELLQCVRLDAYAIERLN